ncbi:peptidyl-prolyl cis-trans isomerase [Helicobacter sp. 13S00401-1]|uniref:peptidyl-prolyl cis-trans isomerase n=1 Tax=Helicobacter sp. 13S00401-1 TaxID=1905758 RepID=UPI000BA6BD84|nr:peptidyl-prolyl cis-trans isomerase [Helicobacter sp. 13S00401-1]
MKNKMLKCTLALAISGTLALNFATAKTLATVNGTVIDDKIFEMIKKQNPRFNYDALSPQEQGKILDQLIDTVLISNEAKKEKLDETPEYKQAVSQLLVQLWIANIAKGVPQVTEAEARKFYNDNKSKFEEQKAVARHILVSTEAEAKSIIDQLNKQPKTKVEDKFKELANQLSIDPSSKQYQNGGSLGEFNLNSMVPAFAEAVKNMKPKTYTKTPVQTQFGYHVIYLDSIKKPELISFDEAKNEIMHNLREAKVQQLIQSKVKKFRDSAKITY